MKRRSFLSSTTAAAVGTQLLGGVPLRAFSPFELLPTLAEENDRILIVIQLFGGNDGLNTVIPCDDPEYYNIRPNIGVQKDKAINVLSKVYLHPALDPANSYNIKRLLEDGRLAIVQGVGYENPNLSHFRSTDIWLSGFNTSNPDDRLIDGWLGRFFARTTPGFPESLPSDPIAVQIGGTLSMLFQSPKGDVGIALTDPEKFFELGQGLSPDLDPMPGDTRYEREFNFVRLVAEQSDRYAEVVKQAFDRGKNMTQYSDNGFVRQMQLVARLISGGLKSKVYMVYMGGFDTHVQQQNDDLTGLHPFLLESLTKGIGQFMQDMLMQGHADRIVGFTASEFGRRPQQNGSRGTDHGAASVQFVFGNRVRSGVFGNAPDLTNLNENGDVRYQYDFRRVYTDVVETWFGGSPEDTEAIFGERILPLGVLQDPVSVQDAYAGRTPVRISAYPNPATTSLTLEWQQDVPASVVAELWGMEGRYVGKVYSGEVRPGLVRIPLTANVQAGSYLCAVTVNGVRNVVPVTIMR
jgi:uncharacterized protein (DUF1501 family)